MGLYQTARECQNWTIHRWWKLLILFGTAPFGGRDGQIVHSKGSVARTTYVRETEEGEGREVTMFLCFFHLLRPLGWISHYSVAISQSVLLLHAITCSPWALKHPLSLSPSIYLYVDTWNQSGYFWCGRHQWFSEASISVLRIPFS